MTIFNLQSFGGCHGLGYERADAPLIATSTLYTLSSNEFGSSEVHIVGTGFTYDAVSGLLNGGTITSMSLVANFGTPDTVQTVTMTGGLPPRPISRSRNTSYGFGANIDLGAAVP